MLLAKAVASSEKGLTPEEIRDTFVQGLGSSLRGANVLVLIPDHTRSLPLPQLFPLLVSTLNDANRLDFMVALGTHPPLREDRLCALVGITPEERASRYRHIGLMNHDWSSDHALIELGTIEEAEVRAIAGEAWHPSLGGDVNVRVNRRIMDYDRVLILGPTFPHEVVGFSGGAKYFFPGISGPEMINTTHWLGALIGIQDVIGVQQTPVRALIHRAMQFVDVETMLLGLVVGGDVLAGVYIGDTVEAWRVTADHSARTHVLRLNAPVHEVLSCAAVMYDELWTAAKAVYKLQPVVAHGGEIILYAPHLDEISHVHGDHIREIGYHGIEYFLEQWDRFKHVPLGVLAHSTHVRGSGSFENGVERHHHRVTLASKISKEDCERLNLGYRDPHTIRPQDWEAREKEGVLYVPKAGEMLYRLQK